MLTLIFIFACLLLLVCVVFCCGKNQRQQTRVGGWQALGHLVGDRLGFGTRLGRPATPKL